MSEPEFLSQAEAVGNGFDPPASAAAKFSRGLRLEVLHWSQMAVEASGAEAPRRGRPPSLTQEQVVEAALTLTDRSCLEDVSMRSLAGELGVPVMTVYNYVASKEVLNGLVIDHVLRLGAGAAL